MDKIYNFIGGEFIKDDHLESFVRKCPYKEEDIFAIPLSRTKEINLAVESAQKSFKEWGKTDTQFRINYLNELAKLIENNFEKFVQLEVRDTGKPINFVRKVDIPRSIENLRFFARSFEFFISTTYQNKDNVHFVKRYPLGVVGLITPWNLPLYLLTWKLAPALIAGNTVVCKPSEYSPSTVNFLCELISQSTLKKDLIQVVHGDAKTGSEICLHKNIKAISFTGGTKAGIEVNKNSAKSLKKVTLELGGKNPHIIYSDYPIKIAVSEAIRAAFSNNGQICLASSRFFIEDKIYDEFKKLFLQKMNDLKIGDPFDNSTDIGPLISKKHLENVNNILEKSVHKNIVKSKVKLPKKGNFISPTVIEVDDIESPCFKEEIFAPIVTFSSFKDTEELVKKCNSTDFGLSLSLWTNSYETIMKLSDSIDCGIFWANSWMNRDLRTPFGGVKSSGLGSEGGFESLEFFTKKKSISLKYNL